MTLRWWFRGSSRVDSSIFSFSSCYAMTSVSPAPDDLLVWKWETEHIYNGDSLASLTLVERASRTLWIILATSRCAGNVQRHLGCLLARVFNLNLIKAQDSVSSLQEIECEKELLMEKSILWVFFFFLKKQKCICLFKKALEEHKKTNPMFKPWVLQHHQELLKGVRFKWGYSNVVGYYIRLWLCSKTFLSFCGWKLGRLGWSVIFTPT